MSCGAKTETSVCDARITDLVNPLSNKPINGKKPDGTVISNGENMSSWNFYEMTIQVHITDVNRIPESGMKIQFGEKTGHLLWSGIQGDTVAVTNIVDGDKIFFNNSVEYANNWQFLILKPTHDAYNSNIVDVSI